jgi:uncharacterized protein YbjT (DUF2867 family)
MQPPPATRERIAIAGASGFVGRALVDALCQHHDVIALGRSVPATSARRSVENRRCDLYDVEQAAKALEGATVAVYLVHSMLPSARLVQASFADLDLVCADNFARAASKANIAHIVYLGGLVPEHADALSAHLRSREEVERVLGSHGARVTTLRAGMVIGAGGSSFNILLGLTRRLPWMIIPRWGSSRTQPIGLDDVVRLLAYAIEHPELGPGAYDVGCPSVLTYAAMLRETGRVLGRRVRILELPFNVPVISLLWVSAITGASLDLVLPLVESLEHEMLATRGLELQRAAGLSGAPFEALVEEALRVESASGARAKLRSTSATPSRPRSGANGVVSLQRFPNPRRLGSRRIAELYFAWLPAALRPLVRVRALEGGGCALSIAAWPRPLLELSLDGAASDEDRTVYRISGGALVDPSSLGRGTLEFRTVLGGSEVIALVFNFEPRLPWFVYKWTQAVAHLGVMRAFGRHLARTGSAAPASR